MTTVTKSIVTDMALAPDGHLKIDWVQFEIGNPSPCCDYELANGNIIPKEVIVEMLQSKAKVRFPSLNLSKPLGLFVEKAEFIKKTFRNTNHGSTTFLKKYPKVVAMIELSRPGFNADKSVAGLYYDELSPHMGGGGSFVLLRRSNDEWKVEWHETIWIE